MQIQNISVIGLGKLGSPILASIASRGFNVIGLDINKDFVDAINAGKPPVDEPQLEKYIKDNIDRITATTDYENAILNTDITFVIVPTPSEENGNFSTKYAKMASENIGKALKNKSDYHLVCLTSTLLPGETEKAMIKTLEENSGKKCGKDFGFCYNPEFIALGDVIQDLLNPDFVLIGEYDKKSGDLLETFYKQYNLNNPPIKRMSIINAELTKISVNTFVTNKISFANTLAMLCDKLPGGNVDHVTDAIGTDTRIGKKYLKGGLGYGGPCFPRDNRALSFTSNKYGIHNELAIATDNINKSHLNFIIDKIIKLSDKNDKIAILGLSYKPNTHVIEESHGTEIAKTLVKKGFDVIVYDPKANSEVTNIFDKEKIADSIEKCVKNTDVICITTPWDEFKTLDPQLLKKDSTIIDCWRILDSDTYKNNNYFALGYNEK